MRTFYKPNYRLIICADIIAFIFVIIGLLIGKIRDTLAVNVYGGVGFIFFIWVISSYFTKRYYRKKKYKFPKELLSLFWVSVLVFVFSYILFSFLSGKYINGDIAFEVYRIVFTLFLIEAFVLLFYGYYAYSSYYDRDLPQFTHRQKAVVLKKAKEIDSDELEDIANHIQVYTDDDSLKFISSNLNLSSSNTKIFASSTMFNFDIIRQYRYDTLINVQKINSMRGINVFLNKVNDKLPDNGLLCICYESYDQMVAKRQKEYHRLVKRVVELYHFITKRILPKLFFTSRLYFDITKGVGRYLSRTEVLGRLYYCGFEVVKEYSSNNFQWIIARRVSNPLPLEEKRYGVIIRLQRVCKNGTIRPIYKLRTMYPYSEYIQTYMYQKMGTDDIGKIKDDIRVTEWGKIFRKYWIDELPMIYNLLKRDLKIVGVRPLSVSNFSTYPKSLQEKRIKVVPGLIPPMYYDLPKTKEDFYLSEERYIESYIKSPIKTDIKYFFGSLYNIIIKKSRSH